MKKNLILLPFALIVVALALAACGGGGSSSSGGGEETAIEETIETAATSTEPSRCTELQTKRFDEQDQGAEGAEAVKLCEEKTESNESPPESVAVSNVEVEGESATADAAVMGSALNGQKIEIELVKEGGKWKLDHYAGFADYEPKAMAEGLEEELSGAEGVSKSLAACVAEGFEEASQEEAEELLFSGSTTGVEELAQSCE